MFCLMNFAKRYAILFSDMQKIMNLAKDKRCIRRQWDKWDDLVQDGYEYYEQESTRKACAAGSRRGRLLTPL